MNYYFTLNNIRGLRRYFLYRRMFLKCGHDISLHTPSITTFIAALLCRSPCQLSTSPRQIARDCFKMEILCSKITLSAIRAEYDQESNFDFLSYILPIKRLILNSKIIKFASIKSFLSSFTATSNALHFGFSSNLVNPIAIASHCEEYSTTHFLTLSLLEPPYKVGITIGYPYLRNFLPIPRFGNQLSFYPIEQIPKSRLSTRNYNNRLINFIRQYLARLCQIIDDFYYLLVHLLNLGLSIDFDKISHLLNSKCLISTLSWSIDQVSPPLRSPNTFSQKINFFDGNINLSRIHHIFYCSSPAESLNFFPGLDAEFDAICRLSTHANLLSHVVIARLHPGWEHLYNAKQLEYLSSIGVLIWNKTLSNSFKCNAHYNLFKYTNYGSIFFESLGEDSACLITSESMHTFRDFLQQPVDIYDMDSLLKYRKIWKSASKALYNYIDENSWLQHYYSSHSTPPLSFFEYIVNQSSLPAGPVFPSSKS